MATRTTIALDDDLLAFARERANFEARTMGEIISETMRKGLKSVPPARTRNGIPLLPVTNPHAVVTMELVNRLRDELP